jgi:hypothetical protein
MEESSHSFVWTPKEQWQQKQKESVLLQYQTNVFNKQIFRMIFSDVTPWINITLK